MAIIRVMRCPAIIEEADSSIGACVPDLPGCVAVQETREEVLQLMQEALEFHSGDLRARGIAAVPVSSVEYVDVGA